MGTRTESDIRKLGSELTLSEGGLSESSNMDVQQILAALSDKVFAESALPGSDDKRTEETLTLLGHTYATLYRNGKRRYATGK